MRILIADDEKKVCQLIYHLIDWSDNQFVGFAHDGDEAYKRVINEDINLLISDIRMPALSGIELIKKIRENDENLKIIIISGYDDFEYAQAACRYGVSDYILKPIKREVLSAAISKMNNKVLNIEKKYSFYELIENNFSAKLLNIDAFSDNLDGLYQLVVFECNANLTKKNNCNNTINQILEVDTYKGFIVESVTYENRFYVLLKHNKKCEEIVNILKNKIAYILSLDEDIAITVVVSKIYENLEDININNILNTCLQKIKFGKNKVFIESDNTNISIINKYYRDYDFDINNLLNKDKSQYELLYIINKFKNDLLLLTIDINSSGYAIVSMIKKFNREFILEIIKKDILEYDIRDIDAFEKKLVLCADLVECIDMLVKNLKAVVKDTMGIVKNTETISVKIAKDYIKSHYMDNISLVKVSEEVGLNSSYFSSLFKKETGINFATYVAQIRIDRAKHLIKTTNYKVSEIMELVGYYDLSSFNKKFKKYTGFSPNEYRKIIN